jgi:hypothetical protein
MKIISRQIKADNLAKMLKKQYYFNGEWRDSIFGEVKPIYDDISKLPNGTLPEDMIKKLKYFSNWLDCNCDVCGKSKDVLALLGNNCELQQIQICKTCLKKSYKELPEEIDIQ